METTEDATTKPKQPQYRLAAMMVWVGETPTDGTELLEKLLDSPSQHLGGDPFRFATDDHSKIVLGRTEYAQELAEVVQRVGTPGLTEEDKLVLAQLCESFKDECELPHDPGELMMRVMWRTFEVNGAAGGFAVLWESQATDTSSVLACHKCGSKYDLAESARLLADEDMDVMLEDSGAITVGSSEAEPSQPDLVVSSDALAEDDRVTLLTVLKDLRKSRERRWRCDSCGNVHGYPGAFIFHGFS